MEKKGRCNRGFVVHSRKGIILIIGVVFSLILLSAFVPLGLTRSKQDIIISTSSHDRIIDLRKGAKVENEVWPCSKDRKVTEEELLSGKYWQCRFSQRNPYSPKDRIPAKAGLDEFPSTGSVKIAIVSDQGMSQATRTLLQQIRDFEPDLVIQNGDFDYKDDPQGFIDMIDDYLPISVPFLAVIGNHDVKQYPEYQSLLKKRLEKGGFQEACFGFIGVHYLCNLYGVLVTSSPAGTIGTHFDSLQIALHQSYQDLITTSQSSKISKWRICSFHKLMNDYQVGIKPDESGYEIYETCRKFGAMIVNGHEHSYSRTKNMVSYPDHSFDDNSTSMLHLKFGLNFAVVTGMGGYGRNPATKEARANPWWASIAAYDDEAMEGALYCTLHSNQKGKCQFKDISEWIRFEESFPSVSTLIWEPTSDFEAEEAEKVILLFPGNPGNIDFYTEFLSRLKVFDSKIVIFGVSYLGHCPQRMKDKYDGFEMERENEREKENENENGGGALYSLEDQKKHVVCVYSYLLNRYKNSQITLIGHSVGAYMNLCVIHARLNDFKSGRIERVIQLFPTVHKIRETPQGNLLSPLFNPFSRFLVRGLMSFVQSFVNCNLRKWLLEKFVSIKVVKNGDFSALSILNEMVDPWLVDNCIFMASQEMAEIGCLQEFLSFEIQSCASLQSKISHYFGLTDRWVPIESHANTISSTFLKHSNHHFCNQGISHAFVLDDKHAAIIADHCLSIIMGKERE